MTARTSLTRGIFVILSAMLLLVSLTGWAASERYLSSLNQVDVFDGNGGGSGWGGDPVNILLVGSDDRSGLSRKQRSRLRTGQEDYGRRTDTIMLIHLGSDLRNVSVISIPRDSLVTIPAHTGVNGEQVPETRGKINSAYASGGPAATVATVQNATGVAIDHYVEVNFKGFLSMVDAIDGVKVCLEEPLYDELSGLDLPAGEQTIRGKQALAYVRARYIDNDFGRSKRQQKFLAAMVQKITGSGVLLNPFRLNEFIDAAVSSVTTDERLGRDDIAALAARMSGVRLDKIKFTTVPVSDGSYSFEGQSTVLWSRSGAEKLFASVQHDEPMPKRPAAVPVEAMPQDISVLVTTPDPELSAGAIGDLVKTGFFVQGPNFASEPITETTIRYDPTLPRSLETMRAVFPDAQFEEVPGLGATFDIQVGEDYVAPLRVRPMTPASTEPGVDTSGGNTAGTTDPDQAIRSAKDSLCS